MVVAAGGAGGGGGGNQAKGKSADWNVINIGGAIDGGNKGTGDGGGGGAGGGGAPAGYGSILIGHGTGGLVNTGDKGGEAGSKGRSYINPIIEDWAINPAGNKGLLSTKTITGDAGNGGVWITTIPKPPMTKMLPDDVANQAGANFGTVIAYSGDGTRVVIGSPLAGPTDTGAVYIFVGNGNTWTQEAKLVSSNIVDGDHFGSAVDITYNGDRIIVGAPNANALPYNQNDSGGAYIFKRNGTSWTEEFYITGGNGGANDYFGSAVSINSDGSIVIIGASGDDTGELAQVGYVYAYYRAGSVWANLDWKTDAEIIPAHGSEAGAMHGSATACNLAGDRAIEGSPTDNNNVKNVTNCGTVTIHHKNKGIPGWKHVSYGSWGSFMNKYAIWSGPFTANRTVTITTPITFPAFGLYWVQMAADNNVEYYMLDMGSNNYSGFTGSQTWFINIHNQLTQDLTLTIRNGSGSGGNPAGVAVRITTYEDNSEVWTTLNLVDSEWTRELWIDAPFPIKDGHFGASVDMDGNGDRVVIGAPDETQSGLVKAGAAYVYRRANSTWIYEGKLTASDKEANTNFGSAVSINGAGDVIAVGEMKANAIGLVACGAVYIYKRVGKVWTQYTKLMANDKAAGDNFGCSVSLNNAGTQVVVGAKNKNRQAIGNAGAVYYIPIN
jgi:hypothetical protein